MNNQLAGPDHWFSENPDSLKIWHDSIVTAWEMLGSSCVKPTEKEKEMRLLARRSIIATNDIKYGELITENNIGLFRPGNGLNPSMFNVIIGKNANRDIKKGTMIVWGDFS